MYQSVSRKLRNCFVPTFHASISYLHSILSSSSIIPLRSVDWRPIVGGNAWIPPIINTIWGSQSRGVESPADPRTDGFSGRQQTPSSEFFRPPRDLGRVTFEIIIRLPITGISALRREGARWSSSRRKSTVKDRAFRSPMRTRRGTKRHRATRRKRFALFRSSSINNNLLSSRNRLPFGCTLGMNLIWISSGSYTMSHPLSLTSVSPNVRELFHCEMKLRLLGRRISESCCL